MASQNVERAILVGDKPMTFVIGGQQTPGSAIPTSQLQAVVQEVTPPDLRPQLGQEGHFDFPYQSPSGSYKIDVMRGNGQLQVVLSPSNGAATANSGHSSAQNGNAASVTEASSAAPPPAVAAAGSASNGVEMLPISSAPSGTKTIGHIDELFRMMKEMDASDLHLSSDESPLFRLQGNMRRIGGYAIHDDATLRKVLMEIAPERNQEQFDAEGDTDFAYELPGVARFRCNYFMDRKGIGAVFRLIPADILTAKQLGLRPSILELCHLSKGLVVVTGPTGSGKSTTLAAMVDYINKNRDEHIITIEDPVEFVHRNLGCLVNQREVHVHTESFKRALRAALREDPDIVLVGEMRDLETIAIAIETAETGHLVFGTLHTTTAPSTVDRIIDQFPPEQQAQIRVMLSESLKGVIAQTLLRTVDGKRVAAHEILLCPPAVANLIREGKTFQLPSQMQIGKSLGMLPLNDSIMEYVRSGRVSPEEAYIKAVDKNGLRDSFVAEGIDFDFGDKNE